MTNRRISRLFAALALLGLTALAQGQTAPASAGLSPKTTAAMRAFVKTTMAQWHVPGAAVGIVKDGRIAFLGPRDGPGPGLPPDRAAAP